jgi:hypothetical protein
MSARARILDILAGHEASRIRFSFPVAGTGTFIAVSHHVFDRVARAIRHDHITVNVTNAMPPNVGAQYRTDADTIDVRAVTGRPDEGLVLHECTHAYFDITFDPLGALDDEAAAYVVDALYFRMTGLARPHWNNAPHPAAGVVADAILREYQRGKIAVPPVPAVPWASLRTAIMSNASYVSGPAGTGGNYLHNGLN